MRLYSQPYLSKVMKILLLALPGAFAAVSKIAYGPSNCVSLDLSSEETCVIKTNCQGVDLEKFEFAFDCTTPEHEVQRHSFGFGGFDSQEVFDTSVKCSICEPPTDKHHVLVGTGSTSKTMLSKDKEKSNSESKSSSKSGSESKKASDDSKAKKEKSESETKVVKYGPNECVSTYRNPAGHCIMQTNCAKENITDYEFGLICVDKTGEPVRHVFGKNSFDQEESFDTLIACDKCVGLDDIADETSLVKQVETLTSEVEDMNTTLSTLRKSVKKLKGKVFPDGAKAEAPAPAPAALPKISSSTKEEPVASHRNHAKLHLKTKRKHSSHMRKIQKDEATDSDDDQDDDQAQDQEEEDQEQDEEQDDSEDA